MRRSRSTGTSTLLAALAVVALGACGVPGDGTTRVIDPTAIPYALGSPPVSTPTPAASPAPPAPTTGQVRVYFLDPGGRLTPVALAGPGAATSGDAPAPSVGPAPDRGEQRPSEEAPEVLASRTLARLVAGPQAQERQEGLQSVLGPDAALALSGNVAGLATVEVSDLSPDQSADRLPLAVGQIVLSLTSIPGITAVRLQRDGVDDAFPLPGGALTSSTLTAADYASLTSA